jgi:hypothetical protein
MNQAQLTAQILSLKTGESLLTQIRLVKNGKIEVELAEKVANPNKKNVGRSLVLTTLNASDAAFSQSGARRAWTTATAVDLKKAIPEISAQVDACTAGEYHNIVICGVKNPKLNGMTLRIQVRETVVPTEYQSENMEKEAKRPNKDGDILCHNGSPIFSNTEITVEGMVENVFLTADAVEETTTVAAESSLASVQDSLA